MMTHIQYLLVKLAEECNAMPELVKRAVLILHGCGPLNALTVLGSGNPGHPLYLPGNLQPQPWTPKQWLQ